MSDVNAVGFKGLLPYFLDITLMVARTPLETIVYNSALIYYVQYEGVHNLHPPSFSFHRGLSLSVKPHFPTRNLRSRKGER